MSEQSEQAAPQPELALSSAIDRNESIVFTELDETIVMMDVDEGQYYELDSVAARIWQLVENRPTVESICDVLAGEYEVEAEECREDVMEFLQAAREQGLVQLAEG